MVRGPKTYVVTLFYGGYKHYLKRVEEVNQEGAPLPVFKGYFSVDLMEAQKFPTEFDAKLLARHFKGAGVETIKTGEQLHGYK